jgi:hypothetical protein
VRARFEVAVCESCECSQYFLANASGVVPSLSFQQLICCDCGGLQRLFGWPDADGRYTIDAVFGWQGRTLDVMEGTRILRTDMSSRPVGLRATTRTPLPTLARTHRAATPRARHASLSSFGTGRRTEFAFP